jgi:hypothetical protein
MKTPPKHPAPKGGVPLSDGAKKVPGSAYEARLKNAPRPAPVTIDRSFIADPRGSAPLVVGHRRVAVADNRSKVNR